MSLITSRHVSVLPVELMDGLKPLPGETWIDATTGAAGHARLIAERIAPTGRLIAIDQDEIMLEYARSQLKEFPIHCFHANFEQLGQVMEQMRLEKVDGLIADLGVSSDQIGQAERGMSFQMDGPLDMRMDQSQGESALDLLNRLDEKELADIFWQYGEERMSRRVARKIVEMRNSREAKPLETTQQLANLVRSCVPRGNQKIDPATRVFQALRIAVNDELGTLERLLRVLPSRIKAGGRVGIISFHSLEDRQVKRAFQNEEIWQKINRKPIQASEEEIARNPRSRSAKLRMVIRQATP